MEFELGPDDLIGEVAFRSASLSSASASACSGVMRAAAALASSTARWDCKAKMSSTSLRLSAATA